MRRTKILSLLRNTHTRQTRFRKGEASRVRIHLSSWTFIHRGAQGCPPTNRKRGAHSRLYSTRSHRTPWSAGPPGSPGVPRRQSLGPAGTWPMAGHHLFRPLTPSSSPCSPPRVRAHPPSQAAAASTPADSTPVLHFQKCRRKKKKIWRFFFRILKKLRA